MRAATSLGQVEGCLKHAILGWVLAALLVGMAVFGPPLTGQSIPGLVELRREVLTIDREFERWSIETGMSSTGSGAIGITQDRRSGQSVKRSANAGGP